VTLSARQRQIVELTSLGHTEREIAAILRIALSTVKNHKQAIFHKLGARNSMEMVKIARGVEIPDLIA